MLILSEQPPIAQGRMRSVYAHPNDPGLIIKVIRPEVIDQRWGSGQPWYKAKRRFRQYISYMRETAEYVAMYASHGRSLPFAQRVAGFMETDLGLGLVISAARDQQGNLAPSLWNLLRKGEFDEQARSALRKFVRQIQETDIIVADLHGGNIVYAYTEQEGNHFVLIDGLGLSNILPLKSVFAAMNQRSKQRHIARLLNHMPEGIAPVTL
ncbi:MAG: YrbL family protein [Verrucomicrobiota bacterium]